MKHKSMRKEKDPLDREIKWLLTITLIAFLVFGAMPYLQAHFIGSLIQYADAAQFYAKNTDRTQVHQSGTGGVCPSATSVDNVNSPTGFKFGYLSDSLDANGCYFSGWVWTDNLLPTVFDNIISSVNVALDWTDPDWNSMASGGGTVECGIRTLGNVDPRTNPTSVYTTMNAGGIGSLAGSCESDVSEKPEIRGNFAVTSDYTTRTNLTDYFLGGKIGFAGTRDSGDHDTGLFNNNLFLRYDVAIPANNTLNYWQLQEHPMYPGTYPVISDGFVGIDGTTFTMDTGTTNADRGEVVLFKQFNKTELSQGTNVVPVDNLMAYYTFEESSGSLINEAGSVGSPISLGTAADGTVEAGITRGDGGKIGSSYLFPGSATGQIQLGSSTSQFNFLHNTTAKWSMNFWYNSTNAGGGTAVIQNDVGTTANRGMDISYTGSVDAFGMGIVRGVLFSSVFGPQTSGAFAPNDGSFHMISITYDQSLSSDNAHYYVDGVSIGNFTKQVSAPSDSNAAVALEMGGYGNLLPYVGNLDEFSIWNDVLTITEVNDLYNSGSGLDLSTTTGGDLPDIKVMGGIQSLGSSANMQVHVEIKDGNFQAGQTQGLNTKDSANLLDVGDAGHDDNAYFERNYFTTYINKDGEPLRSLGVFDISDPTVGTANNFDVSFIPNWDNSTEDIITVFVSVQDNSTSGRLIANITSIEIENNIRYNFTDIQDLIFYEPDCIQDNTAYTSQPGGFGVRGTLNNFNCNVDVSNGLVKIDDIPTTGSFTDPPPTPPDPTNVLASITNFDTVELTWDHPVVNVTNFQIERFNSTSALYDVIATTIDPSDLSFTDVDQPNQTRSQFNDLRDALGLEENTPYIYRVTALNGNSTSSGVVSNTVTTPDNLAFWELKEHDSSSVSPAIAEFNVNGGDGTWFQVRGTLASAVNYPAFLLKSFNVTELDLFDKNFEFYYDEDYNLASGHRLQITVCEGKINRFNTTIFNATNVIPFNQCTTFADGDTFEALSGSIVSTGFQPQLIRQIPNWNNIDNEFVTIMLSNQDSSASVLSDLDIKNFTWTNSTTWDMTGVTNKNYTSNTANCDLTNILYPNSIVGCDKGTVEFSVSSSPLELIATPATYDWHYMESSHDSYSSGVPFTDIGISTALDIDFQKSTPIAELPTDEALVLIYKIFNKTDIDGKDFSVAWTGTGTVAGGTQTQLLAYDGIIDKWNATMFSYTNPNSVGYLPSVADSLIVGNVPFALRIDTLTTMNLSTASDDITVALWLRDDSSNNLANFLIQNITVGDTTYNFNGSSIVTEEVSNSRVLGSRGLITPSSVVLPPPPPPDDISNVNATATENDVFLEWGYEANSGNVTTTETWKYREQDSYGGAFEVCWFFSSSPTIGMEFDEQQGCGQEAGGAWLFKSIPTTEITGSNITIEIGPIKDIGSTLYVFDGFYNENLTTAEWPETFVSTLPTLKGGGILGSLALPSGAGLTTHTLNASSINYAGSTTGNITVAVTAFSSNIFGAENVQIQNINITNGALYNFYNFSASTENDYGTPESFGDFRDSGAFYVPTISTTNSTVTPTDVSIERKLVPGAYSTIVPSLIAVNVTAFNNEEYLDESVSANTTYQYRLTPYNGLTVGNPTESNQVLTNDVSTAPFNLTAAMGMVIPDLEDVFLNWNAPLDNGTGSPGINANITHYWIERKAGLGAFSFLANTSNTVPEYEDESVISGANYTWKVRAVNPVGYSPFSNTFSLITTPIMMPNPPTNLDATAVSGSQINVQWLAGIGGDPPTSYVLQQRHVGFTGFITIATIPAPTLYKNVTTGLLPGNTYDYRVRADNGAGSSGYSNIDQAVTFNIPSAPLALTATTINNTAIFVDWNQPASVGSGITKYNIERESPVGGGFLEVAEITGGVTELVNGTWQYREHGYSIGTNTITGIGVSGYTVIYHNSNNQPGGGSVFKNFPPDFLNNTNITVEWSAYIQDFCGNDFAIRVAGFGLDYDRANYTQFPLDDNFNTVPILNDWISSTYVNICTVDSFGFGPIRTTPTVFTTHPVIIGGPTNSSNVGVFIQHLRSSPSAETGINIYGINITDADTSAVKAYFNMTSPVAVDNPEDITSEDKRGTIDVTNFVDIVSGTVTVTDYSDLGLNQNTIYNYRVNAENVIGTGPYSNQDNDKTQGVPDAPINLSYTTNGISSITVDWDSPVYTGGVPLTAYTIEQAQGIGGTFVNAIPNHAVIPSDNTFIGLLQSTNYIYKIAAKNQYGTGSYSANLTAGTFGGPSEPENFLAVFNSTFPYSVNLSWSVPLDDGGEPIQGYIIQRKNLQNVYVQIANVTNSTFSFVDSSLLQLATHVYRVAAYGSVGDFTADQPVTTVVTPHFQTFTIDNFDVFGDVLRQNYTVVIDDCFPACVLTQADIERNGITESNYVVGSSIPLNTPVSFTTYFIIPNTGTQFINTTALVTNLGSNNSNETGVVTTQLQFVVPTLFFNHTRINNYQDINFTLVRHPIPWSAECTHVISSTFLNPAIGISGTQPNLSLQNIGSYNGLFDANPSLNSYIACYDPVNTQILAFTSFGSGNGTLALTTFTNQLGDFMGVPVPFIFVLFFAAIWTGRSAPTGIIMLAVVIGFLGVLGYFDPLSGSPTQTQSLEAFWGLIVILTLLGVFIGKRFF